MQIHSSDVDVAVCEVGLRDGLQSIGSFFPTSEKAAWIRDEAAAGIGEIEVTYLGRPGCNSPFVDARKVVESGLAVNGLLVRGLTTDLAGAEQGLELGVHSLLFAMSVSRTQNFEYTHRAREDVLQDFQKIAAMVRASSGTRPRLIGGLSNAFGCSYEGLIALEEVRRYAASMVSTGADEILLADSVGYADPRSVKRVLEAVRAEVGAIPLAAHFHDTRGAGLANVAAALECGVRRFDASLAGLGSSHGAVQAQGNIVTEDLCFMLTAMGMRTGVDLEKLLKVRKIVERNLPGRQLWGALARAGVPRHLAA